MKTKRFISEKSQYHTQKSAKNSTTEKVYIYIFQMLSKSSTAHKIFNLRSTQWRCVSGILTELGSATGCSNR